MILCRMGWRPPMATSLANRHSSPSGVPTARIPAASWLTHELAETVFRWSQALAPIAEQWRFVHQ